MESHKKVELPLFMTLYSFDPKAGEETRGIFNAISKFHKGEHNAIVKMQNHIERKLVKPIVTVNKQKNPWRQSYFKYESF